MRSRTNTGVSAVAIAATASLALAACGGAGGPQAASSGGLTDDKIVIGLLNDQSGVYKDLSGPNSKVAIELAIADYKAKHGDKAVAKNDRGRRDRPPEQGRRRQLQGAGDV